MSRDRFKEVEEFLAGGGNREYWRRHSCPSTCTSDLYTIGRERREDTAEPRRLPRHCEFDRARLAWGDRTNATPIGQNRLAPELVRPHLTLHPADASLLLARHRLWRLHRICRRRQRHRHVGERDLQYFVDPFHRADIELFLDVVGDLGQVLGVVVGYQYGRDTPTVRRQELLFESADRQHFAAQRDLARHGDIRAHRNLGERGNQGGGHADAGAGTILRRGALGHVNVHVRLLIEIHIESEHGRAAAHHGHVRLDG